MGISDAPGARGSILPILGLDGISSIRNAPRMVTAFLNTAGENDEKVNIFSIFPCYGVKTALQPEHCVSHNHIYEPVCHFHLVQLFPEPGIIQGLAPRPTHLRPTTFIKMHCESFHAASDG